MDDVLRVVKHHRLDSDTLGRLVLQHPLPDPVEAVGLAGRPRRRPDHEADWGTGGGAHCGDGRGIVGIAADIEDIVGGAERGAGVGKHRADHLRLLPRGNEDREPPRPFGGRNRR